MHLHILGICGTFMGGIAAIARQRGHKVTGSDLNVYPPMSVQLEKLGIALTSGYDAEQLEAVARGADAFIIGNAITRGNPLLEAILDAGLNFTSGPQWLAETELFGKWVLAVAGTHGKTTASAMLARILDHAGLDPGFLIGGVPIDFGVSARATESKFFVIEADEYDTAFFDKRSKFVHYRPRTAILNNLEYDHADIFPDLAAIETQFHHLVRTIPRHGRLVVNGGEESLRRVLGRGCWSEIEYFDADGDASASRPESTLREPGPRGGRWSIAADGTIDLEGVKQGTLAPFPLIGRHNRHNALAAIAAARHAGVPVAKSISALAQFAGIKRRLELRGTVNGVALYDDFAHHPTAIAATLSALRGAVGSARILAVLEPRSNTMKRGTMKAQLPASLAAADRVFCYAPATLGWQPAEALAPLGERAIVHAELPQLIDAIANEARHGDNVLIMSNGGFGGIQDKLLTRLAAAA